MTRRFLAGLRNPFRFLAGPRGRSAPGGLVVPLAEDAAPGVSCWPGLAPSHRDETWEAVLFEGLVLLHHGHGGIPGDGAGCYRLPASGGGWAGDGWTARLCSGVMVGTLDLFVAQDGQERGFRLAQVDEPEWPGGRCSHPDCGPVCVPPKPSEFSAWCPTCRAETRQRSMLDWFGVDVMAECLACGDCS